MEYKIGDKVRWIRLIGETGVITHIDKSPDYLPDMYIVKMDNLPNEYCGSIENEECFGHCFWPEEIEVYNG